MPLFRAIRNCTKQLGRNLIIGSLAFNSERLELSPTIAHRSPGIVQCLLVLDHDVGKLSVRCSPGVDYLGRCGRSKNLLNGTEQVLANDRIVFRLDLETDMLALYALKHTAEHLWVVDVLCVSQYGGCEAAHRCAGSPG